MVRTPFRKRPRMAHRPPLIISSYKSPEHQSTLFLSHLRGHLRGIARLLGRGLPFNETSRGPASYGKRR